MLTIDDILLCKTPDAWVNAAIQHQDILLIDHANCEKKAAATAMHLMHCYIYHYDLLQKMARLAREELLHFQQVTKLMRDRGVKYLPLRPARYAQSLRELVSINEPCRLVDLLIIGALIEARSCERFRSLVPKLDEDLAKFYERLYRAEERHFTDYLNLAYAANEQLTKERLPLFQQREAELIQAKDTEFRFHSGVPVS